MHGHWVHMTVMCIMHNYCPWPCPAGRVTQYIPWWRVGVVYCRARSIYSILLLSCTQDTAPLPAGSEQQAGWVSSSTSSTVPGWCTVCPAPARSCSAHGAAPGPARSADCWPVTIHHNTVWFTFTSNNFHSNLHLTKVPPWRLIQLLHSKFIAKG